MTARATFTMMEYGWIEKWRKALNWGDNVNAVRRLVESGAPLGDRFALVIADFVLRDIKIHSYVQFF